METLSTSTTTNPLDTINMLDSNMSSSPDAHSQFLCMEDLHHNNTTAQSSTSPEPSSFHDDGCSTSQSSPPPVIVQSRQAKKRKSWGQELPEPKTSLPPRKRAKTDDEKEQRRIERIKRNRAAAHNSRERKRQETETLAVALARANAELQAYKKLHGPLPSNIVLPEIQVQSDSPEADTPAPSLVHDAMSPPSPADSIFQHDNIKQEDVEGAFPAMTTLPPAFALDSKPSLLSPLDPTQHSAAMLCDLQCRSSRLSSSMTSLSSQWAQLLLYLMTLQWATCSQTIMMAIWTRSPSLMAQLMAASTNRLTSHSKTSSRNRLPSRSTPRCLALCNTATGLSAPKGSSRDVARRVEGERVERQATEAAHCGIQMALRKHEVTEDQTDMGDDGDEKQGVREFT